MLVGVRYHIGVHAYDREAGQCSPRCLACQLEQFAHRSPDEALDAQPEELAQEGRFEVVLIDQFA